MDKEYKKNDAHIVVFKSDRKNAKCSDLIPVHHLISNSDKIADGRILEQFINTLETICTTAENLNAKRFIIKTAVCVSKNAIYAHPIDDKLETVSERYTYNLPLYSDSVGMLVSYLQNIYFLIYPYMTLSANTILSDPSIKQILENYSKRDKFKIKWKYAEV